MNKRNGMIMGVLAAVVALGAFGYWFVLREPEAPSAPIEAIPLDPAPTAVAEVVVEEDAEEPTPEPTLVPTEAVEEVEEVMEEPTAEVVVEEVAEEAMEASEEEMAEVVVVPAESAGAVTWGIDSNQTSARFELDEDLNGERITVVGSANQVAGQLRFNPADLSTAEIGVIQVNARTFVTDNNRRNNAIQNRILQTGTYEFITFEPTGISGMPASAAIGDIVEFEIEGNLTVRDVTLPAVFSAVIDFVDTNTIDGTAATIISYSDFGINIPNVPVIANVEEELELYIDFRANPIE